MTFDPEAIHYKVVYANGYVEGFWARPENVEFKNGDEVATVYDRAVVGTGITSSAAPPPPLMVVGTYHNYLICTRTGILRGTAKVFQIQKPEGSELDVWVVHYNAKNGERGEIVFESTEAKQEALMYAHRRFLDVDVKDSEAPGSVEPSQQIQ